MRSQSGQYVHDLWMQIHKNGAKIEYLRDVLTFYFHNKIFPEPKTKDYDALFLAFSGKKLSKKMKINIFLVLEIISYNVHESLTQTLRLSPNNNIVADLLSCLIANDISIAQDYNLINKFISILSSQDLSVHEKGKVLSFLSQNLPAEEAGVPVCEQVCAWLKTRNYVSGSTQVDNTSAASGELLTILTLGGDRSCHELGMYSFSSLRHLVHVGGPELYGVTREYCSLLVEQCFRTAQKPHDMALQKAVLCEILHLLKVIRHLDSTQSSHCLLIVKRIESQLAMKKLYDSQDVSIFVSLCSFLLDFGEVTGYRSFRLFETFLGEVLYCLHTNCVAAFQIASFLLQYNIERSIVQKYFPNLMKLAAFHPDTLIEIFVCVMPSFVAENILVEVFQCILDLPVLSASLLIQQAMGVQSIEKTYGESKYWSRLIDVIQSPQFKPTFNYFLRFESMQEEPKMLKMYMDVLANLTQHPLVISTSQIVPSLLNAYFNAVVKNVKMEELDDLVVTILNRLNLLYNIHGYKEQVHKCVGYHLNKIIQRYPQLIVKLHTPIVDYISILNNSTLCKKLYLDLIWAVGEYISPQISGSCTPDLMLKVYETVECLLYESLTQEDIPFDLINITCSTLAKVSSQSQDLIPRVLLSFRKVKAHVKHPATAIVENRIEELEVLLRNSDIASAVFSSHAEEKTMSSVIRVLSQFLSPPPL